MLEAAADPYWVKARINGRDSDRKDILYGNVENPAVPRLCVTFRATTMSWWTALSTMRPIPISLINISGMQMERTDHRHTGIQLKSFGKSLF